MHTHKKNRKEFKHNTKGSHQITREESKRKKKRSKKELKNNPKTIFKMVISTYLIINYFKCKWTKCSNQKTQRG